MTPNIVTEIIALPGWNTSMLLLLGKATLILVAAIAMTLIMKRSAAGARHLVWLVTLVGLLLIPALTAWAPFTLAVLPPAEAAKLSSVVPAPAISNEPETKGDQRALPVAAGHSGELGAAPDSPSSAVSGLSIMLSIWAIVFAAILASLAYGAYLVGRIIRNSTELDTEDWRAPLYEVSDRMSLDHPPRLLRSESAKMPFACGVFKPTIVLPAECDTWTLDRRRAVLLHELAHVRRHDLAGHTLGRLACAMYWFHPLVWTAARQLRNESERACDDIAIACGARASDYAEHLLEIVTSVRGDNTPAVALAMARRKEFEGRMLAILDPELRHSGPTRRHSLALIASLALISIVVGAAAPARRVATPAADDLSFETAPAAFAEPQLDDKARADAVSNVDGSIDQLSPADSEQPTVEQGSTGVNDAYTKGTSVSVDLGSADGLKALMNDEKQDDRAAILANILRTEADPKLRKLAAWGLAEYADTNEGKSALAYALTRDSNADVREMAAWALEESDGSGVAFDALSAAVRKDASPRVRTIAVWALGQTEGEAAVDPLTAALSDPDQGVRVRAVWALGAVEAKSAPAKLIAMLRDGSPKIRHLVAWSLFKIQDPAAVPALNAALSAESDKNLQLSYIRALASTGERSVDAVRGLINSPDPQIKAMAIRALAGRGGEPWPWPWPEPRPFP